MPKISFSLGLALATLGLALGVATAAGVSLMEVGDRGSGRLEARRCNGGDCRGEFPETAPRGDLG
jgi:hypothetical protein